MVDMNYPQISEYIEAIRWAEDNFATLTHLRPVLGDDGNPVMSSGNFAVVFKMRDEQSGKLYALKCFIKEQHGRATSYKLISSELAKVKSDYVLPIKYLSKELYIARADADYPVLLMDWVDGITLDKYVRRHLSCPNELQWLSYRFGRLASWLMSQPFAHGDLKPDNVLVRPDGTLVLVDYDGMFVPGMEGQSARELGSPDYRHPALTANYFGEHIDDFALAAIAMQLAAIAYDPTLLGDARSDTLLLTERDHRDPADSPALARLRPLLSFPDFERLYALYHLAHAQATLFNVSLRAFLLPEPPALPLSTIVTDEDLKNGIKDEYGALYSPDGLRLLKGPDIKEYSIRPGTKVICNFAFFWSDKLTSVTIPNSVTHIGDKAFLFCGILTSITIPNSVTHIGDSAFSYCRSLSSIIIPSSVIHLGDSAFSYCSSLSSIIIPSSVIHLGNRTFANCYELTSIAIPCGSREKFKRMLPSHLHDKLKEQ